jgi:hypothetical protein
VKRKLPAMKRTKPKPATECPFCGNGLLIDGPKTSWHHVTCQLGCFMVDAKQWAHFHTNYSKVQVLEPRSSKKRSSK